MFFNQRFMLTGKMSKTLENSLQNGNHPENQRKSSQPLYRSLIFFTLYYFMVFTS